MSIKATWDVYDPEGSPALDSMEVHAPDDVALLVTRLSGLHVAGGTLVHTKRPEIVSPYSGEVVPDHVLQVLVNGGFGYVHFHSPEHVSCSPVGDPDSGFHHYEYTDFEAGSGLPLPLFTRLLTEFLATAERPTCVTWRNPD
ncbi:Imm1 family immunity protein [Actinosynnema sp. NPDC050436]|uniref:Imm1 family immunity protein n=1 Tax=Actinosynnema sp. NPDC050436 TaxID=3155659 RepID=UPI0033EB2DE5